MNFSRKLRFGHVVNVIIESLGINVIDIYRTCFELLTTSFQTKNRR